MNAGETLEGNRAADGSQLIRSNTISTEMMTEIGQQPLNLTVSNSVGGRKVSEDKSWQAVPIKIERMDEEAELSTTNDVEDFDIYSAMEWKNGVGSLPGSDLKFQMNEFGALEIITTEEQDAEPSAQIAVEPTVGMRNAYSVASNAQEGVIEDVCTNYFSDIQGICCCENCGGYGTMGKFNKCDHFCGTDYQQLHENEQPTVDHAPVKQNAGVILKRTKKRKKKVSVNPKEESDEDLEDDYMEEVQGDGKQKMKMPALLTDHSSFKNSGLTDPNSKLSKQAMSLSGKKKAWSWVKYLGEEKALAAPPKLFNEFQIVPQNKNGFKVGMKLEGIDPRHPSMFCVLSVAEVCGVRLRLHFDRYSECFDFWINNDSPDIHPVGWCEKTSHKLHPPKGCKEEFNWASYLKVCKAQSATKNLFKIQNTTITPSGFRIGMKLEAVDRKNPSLICVATVTDIIDNRFLVHFDNWDDTYDYWCDASSPYIHPVGWCQDQGKPLTPPQGYHDPENFSWRKYLEDMGATSAPARAFKIRPPHGFQVNMKLEAVDKRNPMLIRVATVADANDQRIKIHFDGWSHNYDYWLDADHPDIHPAGWCAKTNHPLQPPLNSQSFVAAPSPGGCPTLGCIGVGHIKGSRYSGHHSAFGCPYSELNMKKESIIHDRLGGEKQMTLVPIPFVPRTKRLESNDLSGKPEGSVNDTRKCPTPGCNGSGHITGKYTAHHRLSGCPLAEQNQLKVKMEPQDDEGPTDNKSILSFGQRKRTKQQNRLARPAKYLKIKENADDIDLHSLFKDLSFDSMQQALHQSVFMSAMSAHPVRDLPLCWEQHCKLLPSVVNFQASKVSKWSIDEVANFVQTLPGCEEQAKIFKEEQIDGEAFLLLTQMDIIKIMSIKLGPALKIYNSILMFKNSEDDLE